MGRLISIHWPFVFVTTIVLYALILITLPLNTQTATVFLFLLVAYWSRIPGCGIPTPWFVLYQADLVDMFTMLVAINIGPGSAIAFTMFANIASRAAGTFPTWTGVITDACGQSFASLLMPFIHAMTGNVFTDMIIYTMIRRTGFLVGHFVYPQFSSFLYLLIAIWPMATATSLAINAFYGKYFGFYFDGLMHEGVKFNWIMFIIATAIVITMWRLMVGKRTSKYLHQGVLMKKVVKKVTGHKEVKKPTQVVIEDEELIGQVKQIIADD